MPKIKITRSTLQALRPEPKPTVHWDKTQTGFGVRVQPSGSMSFVCAYRLKGSSTLRFVTLGKVKALAPEQARDRARALIAAARSGRDLDAEAREGARASDAARRQGERRITVGEAKKLFLEHLETETSERTGRKRSWSTVKATVLWLAGLEPFGAHALADITAADLKGIIAATPQASRRNISGGLKRFFTWAVEAGMLSADPSLAVKRAKGPAARERTPSVDEVRAILKAIDALVDEGKWLPVQGAAVRTLVFTGQRRQDVTEMRWEDLDLKAATWTQPAIRNKSKRLHSVPLIEPLLSMLKGHHEEMGRPKSGLVFPGVRSGRAMTPWMSEANEHLRERSGISFVLHDFRRSMVSAMADHGVAFEVADSLLNHAASQSRSGIVGVYQRSTLWTQKVQALALWSRLLLGSGDSSVLAFPSAAGGAAGGAVGSRSTS
jgi:integrase